MNILRDGIILAIYLFIIMSLYVFTSGPFHDVTTAISATDIASDTKTQGTFTTIDTVYMIIFIILAGIPSFWFVMKVFERNPEWGYYR